MLTTGQVLTNNDSQTPSSLPVSANNVVRELVAAGKTWKAYAERPAIGRLPGRGYHQRRGTILRSACPHCLPH